MKGGDLYREEFLEEFLWRFTPKTEAGQGEKIISERWKTTVKNLRMKKMKQMQYTNIIHVFYKERSINDIYNDRNKHYVASLCISGGQTGR